MSVATFISTISTTITLLIGIVLFLRELRDRQKAQVSKVACWLHTVDRDHKKDIVLMLNNDSPQPIYNVMFSVRIKAPENPASSVEMREFYNVLPPGFKEALPGFGLYGVTYGNDNDRWIEKEQEFYRAFSFKLTMTDVSGHRWVRNEQGSIKKVHSLPGRRR